MNSNKSITAVFESTAPPPPTEIYTLMVNVWPTGSGSVMVDPQKPLYAQDEQVTLTAIPASGNTFDMWTGDGNGATDNPLTITMWYDMSITANFEVPVQEMEVPAGGIIMYTGSDTPDGFTKIDGLHFVQISSSTSVNKTATINKLTNHTHSIPASSTNDAHSHSTSSSTDTPPGEAIFGTGLLPKTASVHSHTTSSNNTSQNGGHSHPAMTSNASGNENPPYLKLNFIKNTSGGLKIAPIGSIVMVDYAKAPNGWAVCNGENGTVNLLNRFAYGTQNNEDLLGTGGSETHAHPAKTTGSAGGHIHTLSVSINSASGSVDVYTAETNTQSAPTPHNHGAVSFTLPEDGAHIHTYPQTNAANHLPPYVYLFYIQRIT